MAEFDTLDLTAIMEQDNITEVISDDVLDKIGQEVVETYHEDKQSRSGWEKQQDTWMKLASQVLEEKSHPWPNSSNVKYPLLATAALQFHARAYPALIPNDSIVKIKSFGTDQTGEKAAIVNKLNTHMSYQLLVEQDEWQEDMDRMMAILPIVGLAYKKAYYSVNKERNVSELVLARDLVVNYWAKDLERAVKTHRMYMDQNEVYEYKAMGIYRDIDLTPPEKKQHEGVVDQQQGITPTQSDEDAPHEILECHTWYDLDEDGYKEPYIITVDLDSEKVLRIVPRWEEDAVEYSNDGSGRIVKINPTEYFTAYGFLPNPESKIYYIGFGNLVGPINSAVNTIINQLVDAGTLNNLQGGFLSKQVKVRGGKMRFRNPGEWKILQSSAQDIRQGIFPLPTKEPSNVLFQLLGLMIESGERLVSVKDIMVGESPGQNQPYATTVAVLEQGLKVFVGIYKRLYRALSQEYRQLFRLNSLYLEPAQYNGFFDDTPEFAVTKHDYDLSAMAIYPNADPNMVTDAQKALKAESLLQKMAAGIPLNLQAVTKAVLEAEGHDNIQELMTVEPQEDPEITLKKAELEHRIAKENAELQIKKDTTKYEALKDFAQAIGHIAKAMETEAGGEREDLKVAMELLTKQSEDIQNSITMENELKQGAEGEVESQPQEG